MPPPTTPLRAPLHRATKTEFELREEADGSLELLSKLPGGMVSKLRVGRDHESVHELLGYSMRATCYFESADRLVQRVVRTKGGRESYVNGVLMLRADDKLDGETFEAEGNYKKVMRRR